MLICNVCLIEKDESCFYFRKDNGKYRPDCKECRLKKQAAKYPEVAEQKRKYAKEYIRKNYEKRKAYEKSKRAERRVAERERRKRNLEKYREYDNKRYKLNPNSKINSVKKSYQKHKDKRKEYKKKYNTENRGKINFLSRTRELRKIQATPKWLTEEQKAQMREIYMECKNRTIETGIEHNVDHIVPLRNKNVCGLHVPWNLQILTKEENSIKSNRLEQKWL